jgi:RNA polymerase sigma-70 factor (ECF subfamily)
VATVIPLPPRGDPQAEPLESELAVRVRAGDAAAFEALFHRHYRRLHAFIDGYVGSAEVAEDLAVDVFTRIWERRAEWEVRGSVRAYLYGAARNEALAHLRRRRMMERAHAEAARDLHSPGVAGPSAAADARLEASELEVAVEAAIARLPERGREALVLHRKHGLSYVEVADAMGISPRTVEVHIRRAFVALRTELAPFIPFLLLLHSLR